MCWKLTQACDVSKQKCTTNTAENATFIWIHKIKLIFYCYIKQVLKKLFSVFAWKHYTVYDHIHN